MVSPHGQLCLVCAVSTDMWSCEIKGVGAVVVAMVTM